MRSPARFGLVVAALLAVGGASPACRRRPLEPRPIDAGGEGGGPSLADAGRVDAADAADVDGAGDAFDAFDTRPADVARDGVLDVYGPQICPVGVAPLDVCGCGCCGAAARRDCYYPSLGESRDTVPNPMPTPHECSTTGCSEGDRYLCCADTLAQPAPGAIYCAQNSSLEDLPRFRITRRDDTVCTTVEIGGPAQPFPISAPGGSLGASGWRGPCDTSPPTASAIGGIGAVTLRPFRAGDAGNHYDVHVALFFDSGAGIADTVRIDVDDIGLAPWCAANLCPTCAGPCTFDTTYRYGFVGGRVAFMDTVVLAAPGRYEHIRAPTTTMPADITCAPPPPACGGPGIDVAAVTAALGDADVQQALARSLGAGTIPFYGQDPRPSDGQAFQITRAAGGGFLIGAPCPAGATPSSCTEIPGGLSRLQALLVAFDQQQLADASCAPLRP